MLHCRQIHTLVLDFTDIRWYRQKHVICIVMKGLDVQQIVVSLSVYSFPYRVSKQIHFLSVLHDAIKHTGNNMTFFSVSHFPHCDTSVSYASVLIFDAELFPCLYCKTCLSAGFTFAFCHGCFAPSSSLLSTFIWSCDCSFELKMWCFKAKSGALLHPWRPFGVWSNFIVTPVERIFRGNHLFHPIFCFGWLMTQGA